MDLEVPLDVVVVCLFVFNKGIALTRKFQCNLYLRILCGRFTTNLVSVTNIFCCIIVGIKLSSDPSFHDLLLKS